MRNNAVILKSAKKRADVLCKYKNQIVNKTLGICCHLHALIEIIEEDEAALDETVGAIKEYED